ncbi:PREDICTED: zinc finger Y-chromosomal protein 2-like [Papilio polytes]|uniref:zinc finger Y-chromosomal protein 2-like n=1 Tax=Papilio polytes TaxID=76194 RepID=UPI0006762421|nr:PREDICTED: zinc finger Y-chromosomal protein 2-like [Papilio polytes]
MNQYCFVCNSRAGVSLRNAVNIFGENSLQRSGKSMVNILSEILGKPIKEKNIHSKILCNKCHKTCIEYDSLQIRLQVIKTSMSTQFQKTLPRHNLDYDTYNEETSPQKFSGKKLILPASKLQPLPSDFVLKGGKLGASPLSKLASKLNNPEIRILSPSTLNLKVTVGSSVLTQSIKTGMSKQRGVTSSVMTHNTVTSSVTSSSFTHTKTSPALSFSLDVPPNDIFSTEISQNSPKSDENGADGNQPMEMDEACSLAVITNSGNDRKLVFEDISDKNDAEKSKSYFDVDLLSSLDSPVGEEEGHEEGEGKYVVGKLHMMQDDEQPRAGAVLRVLGQQLVCGAGDISLLLPDREDVEGQDTQDSNSESQFELHVSGDEETANAIIAAAQEQGGAFIKVESGEMFRVQSVQSKTEEVSGEDDAMLLDIIARENGQFKCLICQRNDSEGAQFVGSAAGIAQHMRTAHGARIHICALCGLILRKKADYLAHLGKHKNLVHTDKSKLHECNVCQKKYNSKATLAEHMHTHTGSKPHTCSLCEKSFASKYTLQSHLKTHLERPRPFKCSQCGKSFLTQQNLNQHEKTHSGVKEFICKVCGKAFGALHNLEVHGVVHSGNKPFVCGICSKGFARRAEVRDHMRIHTGMYIQSGKHTGTLRVRQIHTNNYLLTLLFVSLRNVRDKFSANSIHNGMSNCNRSKISEIIKDNEKLLQNTMEYNVSLLDYHVKASHTGERPLQCEVCQASFVYPEHFKKHMRIHSGEKPYSCEVCGRQFNTRDNLNTHLYVHSDKKPYECVVCCAGYMRKQQLYHHMKNAGHLAESIVVNQPRILKVPQSVVTSAGTIIIDPGKEEQTSNIRSSEIFEAQDNNEKSIENSTLDIAQNNEVQPMITLHNISTEKEDNSLLETVSEEQLNGDDSQIETIDATNANVTRLIQFQLPDGTSGWLAV